MRRITALLISLWLGFHLSVGCVVAPLVSNHLNTSDSGKTLADTLSGSLFHIANLFTLAVWLIVYFTARSDNRMAYHKSRTPFWAGTLLVFTAINEWFYHPRGRRPARQSNQLAAQHHRRTRWHMERHLLSCLPVMQPDWLGTRHPAAAPRQPTTLTPSIHHEHPTSLLHPKPKRPQTTERKPTAPSRPRNPRTAARQHPKTGGHFASNLGAVELTLALHYVYNAPHDHLVWDVGHQTIPTKS